MLYLETNQKQAQKGDIVMKLTGFSVEIVDRTVPQLNSKKNGFSGRTNMQVAIVHVDGDICQNDESKLMKAVAYVIKVMGYKIMTAKDCQTLVDGNLAWGAYVFLEFKKD